MLRTDRPGGEGLALRPPMRLSDWVWTRIMMATPDSDILVIEPSRDLVFRGELMWEEGFTVGE